MKIIALLFWSVAVIWLINQSVLALGKTKIIDKKLRYEDFIYDDNIRTVLLYPRLKAADDPSNALNPAVISMREENPMVLEFDFLGNRFGNFRAKIFHCNTDWTPSVLSEVEYLPEYNDFPIAEYQSAYSTKVPYYHYTFEVPKVKLPGNYILMVYGNGNKNDYMFTRRFMVHANSIGIEGRVHFSNDVRQRNTTQQVDFQLSYNGFQIVNPREDVKIVIRQNFRWDKSLTNLKPFNVNEFDKKIEYNFFDLENSLSGGNEFRMFDARSYQTKLMNVAKIDFQTEGNRLTLLQDTPQGGKAYIQMEDFDGAFVIDQYETRRGANEADYVQVVFTLRSDELTEKNIYVNGAFNFWQLNDRNKMTYFPAIGAYQAMIWLKQGIYNYNYVTEETRTGKRSETELEGSHSQTQNTYEILVYSRPLGARADQLVGYRILEANR
ncbi:MAG: DUF5103 domain-containing protein [Spirosomataceae bacterium]|mgnify:CR=1 FL=1